jgi:hypothetical protein
MASSHVGSAEKKNDTAAKPSGIAVDEVTIIYI